MIKLYGGSSPNVKKVSIMLEELELPHEYLAVNCMKGENYAAEFAQLNPLRKIPVLVDGDGPGNKPCTVFESGAILIYLAEKSRCFLPAGGAARYAVLQWLMVQMSGIGPLFGQFTHFRRFAPPGNDYALARYETASRRMLESLDEQLAQQRYVAGDDYSIADMAIYPWTRNRPKVWGGDWSRYTNVWRWFEEVDKRPAVARMNQAYQAIEAREQQEGLKASADDIDRFLGRGRFSQSTVAAEAGDPNGNFYAQFQARDRGGR
jgi:GSH-dependent disulfide-bond oxidoreductase